MNYECRYDQSFYVALTFLIVITDFTYATERTTEISTEPTDTTDTTKPTKEPVTSPTIVITDFTSPEETTEPPVETTYATERTTEISTEPTDTTDTTKPTKEPVTSTTNSNTRPPGLNFDFQYFVFCLILSSSNFYHNESCCSIIYPLSTLCLLLLWLLSLSLK